MIRLLPCCLIIGQLIFVAPELVYARPVFEYPQDSTFLLISYSQKIPLITNQDPQPTLQIFGNGKVMVHFPVYMKKAGDYEMQLSQEQLHQLLRLIEERNLFQFDRRSVLLLKQDVDNRVDIKSKNLNVRSEHVHTNIQVNLEFYSSPEKGIVQSQLKKRISWTNLKWEAQQYPNITALVNAAIIEEKLQQIINHPGLRKIK